MPRGSFIRFREREECLDPGVYLARLHRVTDDVSKKGLPMQKVEWTITDQAGKTWSVWDWFVAGKTPWKSQGLAEAWELTEGEVASVPHFYGRRIKVRLGLARHEEYGWKNTIEQYIAPEGTP